MQKWMILVLSAICCAALVVFAAVGIVALATSSSPPEADDIMSDSTVTSQPADHFTGTYAYNLGSKELENLSPDDEILRCWGWNKETAERYAYQGEELDAITDGPDGGTYCQYVSAEELLS
jgi:hypothetical protein